MEKIVKQVTINFILVVVSVLVIFFAKTFVEGKVLGWKAYLGTDVVFVMITSLVTTIGWRFSENIKGHWLYNIIVGLVLFFFSIEYGVAIALSNDILKYSIAVSLVFFLFFYLIENCIIIVYFKKSLRIIDKLSYNDET